MSEFCNCPSWWLVGGRWWRLCVGETADGADFGCGETGAEVGDCFFAVVLGLGGYATAAYQNQIGRFGRDGARPSRNGFFGRDGARPSQINDFVSGGAVAGFEVKGFGSIEAASECDKGDFHSCGFEGALCEKSPQQCLNFLPDPHGHGAFRPILGTAFCRCWISRSRMPSIVLPLRSGR